MPNYSLVSMTQFKLAIAELEKCALSEAAASVVGKIKEGIQFREMGIDQDECALFIARVEGTGRPARGLLKMTKRGGVWWIDDVVSAARGCGSGLARVGIEHAKADYGSVPNRKIQLISLNEASTGFWERFGFRTNSGVVARSSIGMTLTIPNTAPLPEISGITID